jgi:hypothetical protein
MCQTFQAGSRRTLRGLASWPPLPAGGPGAGLGELDDGAEKRRGGISSRLVANKLKLRNLQAQPVDHFLGGRNILR